MIKEIIISEIKDRILSVRFFLSISVSVVVFMIASLQYVNDYSQRIEKYSKLERSRLTSLHESSEHLNQLAFSINYINKKPQKMSFIAEGNELDVPDQVGMNAFFMTIGKADISDLLLPFKKSDVGNYRLRKFLKLDWVFIIGILFSFITIVMSYDLVSGAKNDGTLKLMSSFSVSKFKIMAAKYLAVMSMLFVILICGILTSILIIKMGLGISYSIADIGKLFISILISLLYLSFFAMLSIWISASVKIPSSGLAYLLFTWVMIVFFLPPCISMVAQKFYKTQSFIEVSQNMEREEKDMWDNAPDEAKSYFRRKGVIYPHMDERVTLSNRSDELFSSYQNSFVNKQLSNYLSISKLTCFSPFAAFRYTQELVVGTGMNSIKGMWQHALAYRESLNDFVNAKDKLDNSSAHFINSWHPEGFSEASVAVDEIPSYVMQESKVDKEKNRLIVVYNCLILLGFNLFTGLLAFIKLVRYDVR